MTANKAFAFFASLVVVIAVAGGLYVGGWPGEQRLFRFDERRIADLRELSRAIEWRWDKTKRLPEELGELVDGQRLRSMPVDPATSSGYVYEALSGNTYRLCAEFSKPSVNPDLKDFWVHQAGYQCFEFALVVKDN